MKTTNIYRPECSKPLKLDNCSRLKLILQTVALKLKPKSSNTEKTTIKSLKALALALTKKKWTLKAPAPAPRKEIDA